MFGEKKNSSFFKTTYFIYFFKGSLKNCEFFHGAELCTVKQREKLSVSVVIDIKCVTLTTN